jgi:hypothetical protein
VSTPLHLKDLRLAWEAHDPELVALIETLVNQPDEPPETPPRDGAPTFERFLATIRSWAFRHKSKEEQEHYRREQLKALEAPDAEVPLPDRLRAHEILLALWADDSVFARTCLLRVIATVPLVYGPWRALKRIFKEAEAKGDTEVYGALAARFDMAQASGGHSVSAPTMRYLVRRAWRTLRYTAVRMPVAYADTAADVLAHYTDATRWPRTWVANHVFYHQTKNYTRERFTFYTLPKNVLKDRAYPELWKRSPRPLFSLLERAQSDQVRAFATEALKADFRALLREVEPAWVARLVGVGSKAIDDFVVWILNNVPRFEQGAFRTLGLHEAVLRLFDSPSAEARAYAAAYARTHARDLPVAELVRLTDNGNEAVRKLALDLLKERNPRTEVGLDGWGWLLETTHGHKLAAEMLRKHFGPRELTPEWFTARLFSPNKETFAFVGKLLPEVHPVEKLGPAFFTDLIDSLKGPLNEVTARVAAFALEQLGAFDPNTLGAEFLQRLVLHPNTRAHARRWIDEGKLKVQTLPPAFWKVLAYHPAWEADPWLAGLRRGDREWARELEFDEALAEVVLGWLGDVRRFAVADLGFDWLMQLVDRSEPRYHDFAVTLMIKALRPADFAPRQEAKAAPAAPAAVNFAGASFLFTGKMATMPRKDAEDRVKQYGGVKASSVTKNLHYLVIGDEGSPLYSGGAKGDKQTKAEQLNGSGANIRIISETAFLQMLSGTAPAAAESGDVMAGCETLWRMAVAPGASEARRGEFARKYVLAHHPEIAPAKTARPVDPGAEVPTEFLTFERVEPLFAETRTPLREFALELAAFEFARWKPSADALLALSELPHADVRHFVAEALLADDDPEKRRFRIDPDTLSPESVYRFCESSDQETRRLGMQIIARSPRLQVPEEMFRLTESPDRMVRSFVIRSLWAVYRDRGLTPDWKPPVPQASSIGAAAKKAAAAAASRGGGVPHRPEKPPSGPQSLAEFLRRVLFEIPPGPPPKSAGETPAKSAKRLRPLPARRAKLELVEVIRDLALEDGAFAAGVSPLLQEFMVSRGESEKAACLVALTRIRHTHAGLRPAPGNAKADGRDQP